MSRPAPSKIKIDPTRPRYVPLTGWRRVAAWFRLPVKRGAYIYYAGKGPDGGALFHCHPGSVPALQAWLERQHVPYTIESRLAGLPGGKS